MFQFQCSDHFSARESEEILKIVNVAISCFQRRHGICASSEEYSVWATSGKSAAILKIPNAEPVLQVISRDVTVL
jgi:hypothetical protein